MVDEISAARFEKRATKGTPEDAPPTAVDTLNAALKTVSENPDMTSVIILIQSPCKNGLMFMTNIDDTVTRLGLLTLAKMGPNA